MHGRRYLVVPGKGLGASAEIDRWRTSDRTNTTAAAMISHTGIDWYRGTASPAAAVPQVPYGIFFFNPPPYQSISAFFCQKKGKKSQTNKSLPRNTGVKADPEACQASFFFFLAARAVPPPYLLHARDVNPRSEHIAPCPATSL